MFWLFIVGLFCYFCIFYYLYVDSLTYAFGWSAFLCRIRFCDTLVVIFLSKHHHHHRELLNPVEVLLTSRLVRFYSYICILYRIMKPSRNDADFAIVIFVLMNVYSYICIWMYVYMNIYMYEKCRDKYICFSLFILYIYLCVYTYISISRSVADFATYVLMVCVYRYMYLYIYFVSSGCIDVYIYRTNKYHWWWWWW
jgi:hypothetical protein